MHDTIDEREHELLLAVASAAVTLRDLGARATPLLLRSLAALEEYRRERDEEPEG